MNGHKAPSDLSTEMSRNTTTTTTVGVPQATSGQGLVQLGFGWAHSCRISGALLAEVVSVIVIVRITTTTLIVDWEPQAAVIFCDSALLF